MGSLLAHGADAPLSDLLGEWNLAPPVLAAVVVACALYARAFLTLRRRGRPDHAGWTHALPFLAGLLVLTLALVSPLAAAGEQYLLSAHMLQHVLIGDLATALLVVGLRGPLTFLLLPRAVLRAVATTTWLRRALRFVSRPKASFAAWALTLAVWHVPVVTEAALTRAWLHEVEHASFIAAGVLIWAQLIDPARRRELGLRGRVLFAGALFAAAHLFIHPVLLSGTALYPAYASQPDRLFGLSPLADQHSAAAVMTFEQIATLGAFLLLVLRPGFGRPPAPVRGRRARRERSMMPS